MKPFSKACENNKLPILNVISSFFSAGGDVFEIGSGTGQHAVFFANNLPAIRWHTSDLIENHVGIVEWIQESMLPNVIFPIELDVVSGIWPKNIFDGVFTANTCHIMHWHEVVTMVEGVKRILSVGGIFMIYGPFNYNNDYTSSSNRLFDDMLRARDRQSGLRNFEDLELLTKNNSFILFGDVTMPANNRLLIFKKIK
ncbi:MAG: methylase [Legionellales bacterium]|nr:methylase [Legionellales bacterium]|tara:strand:- start:1811 stop:2404 length:594 start_codon:yes stop_codon:yes gene_type:complete